MSGSDSMPGSGSNRGNRSDVTSSELPRLAERTGLLFAQYQGTSDLAVLDECIQTLRQILELCPVGAANFTQFMGNLAFALYLRFQRAGDITLLEESIDLGREVLRLRPVGHPNRAVACEKLATCLAARFDQTGDEALLEEAISLGREALELRPPEDPNRLPTSGNLAALLQKAYTQTKDQALFDEAIRLEREVLDMLPLAHPERGTAYGNLAVSLKARFDQTGDESVLGEAISLEREALQLCPPGHPGRDRACENLAASLFTLFILTGDEVLIDETIILGTEALRLRPLGHPARWHACGNLAAALKYRYDYRYNEELLDQAIILQRHALEILPLGHSGRAIACGNLAAFLKARYDLNQMGDEILLHEIIGLEREALRLRPQEHVHFAQHCMNLAVTLEYCLTRRGNDEYLDEIMQLSRSALESWQIGHPYRWRPLLLQARLYLDLRYECGDIESGVKTVLDAVTHNAANIPILFARSAECLRRVELNRCSAGDRVSLLQAYSAVIDLALLLAGFVLTQARQLYYMRECGYLGSSAYFVAISLEDPGSGLELLERARGVVWIQSLHLRDPQLQDLEAVRSDLATELDALLRKLGANRINGSSSSEDRIEFPSSLSHGRDAEHQDHGRVQRLIREIREMPGFAHFMRGPSLKALRHATASYPAVILVAKDEECQALVIRSPGAALTPITLTLIKASEIEAMVDGQPASRLRGSDSNTDDNSRMRLKKSQPQSAFHHVLSSLWIAVVKPVIEHLQLTRAVGRARPRIHWCPTGVFTFAPLHAAGIYEGPNQECISDYVVSSYTPTLAALLRAQRDAHTVNLSTSKLSVIAAERAQDPSLSTLWKVKDEAAEVVKSARKAGISVENEEIAASASISKLPAQIESSHFVHIACHGIQDSEEPLRSRFCVSDGDATVEELMKLDLKNAFLAFLSACETAKGDKSQPDETIHLAATMLFVGFKSVVATLWAMSDHDGPYIAERFYNKLFEKRQVEMDDVPYALNYAVAELRKTGVPPERWAAFIHAGA